MRKVEPYERDEKMAVEIETKKGGILHSGERVVVAEAWVEDAVRRLQSELEKMRRHVSGAEPYDKRLAVYYARKFSTRSLPEIAEFFNMKLGAVNYAIKDVESRMTVNRILEEVNGKSCFEDD